MRRLLNYEKRKLIRVERDKNGQRDYQESDEDWIVFIKRLKETGMPLSHIQNYAELRYKGDETILERLNLLKKHSTFVKQEVQKWTLSLEKLEEKIAIYQDKLK